MKPAWWRIFREWETGLQVSSRSQLHPGEEGEMTNAACLVTCHRQRFLKYEPHWIWGAILKHLSWSNICSQDRYSNSPVTSNVSSEWTQRLVGKEFIWIWEVTHKNPAMRQAFGKRRWEAFLLREVGSQPNTARILCHRIRSHCYQREEPIKHTLLIRGFREGSMRLSTTRPDCHPSALAQETAVLTRDEKRRWGMPESRSSLQRHTPSDLSSPAKPSAPPVAPRWELSPWP